MQQMDKFMLAVAVIWVLFTCYGVMMLLPFMNRRMRAWDTKLKRGKGTLAVPNHPQQVVFLLLTCLMTAVSLASAFHRNLSEMIGINSWTPCLLMMLLPVLYFALGLLKKPH